MRTVLILIAVVALTNVGGWKLPGYFGHNYHSWYKPELARRITPKRIICNGDLMGWSIPACGSFVA
jgi:hypothetical protein